MASGDVYFDTCDKQNLGLESLLKILTVYDCEGKAALRTLDKCSSGGGGGGSFPDPIIQTPSFERVTGAGTYTGGYSSISIANSGNANGTVLGATLKPGEKISWSAQLLNSIGNIDYNATGTEFIVTILNQ